MIRALIFCLLALFFSTSFGQESQSKTESMWLSSSGEGYGLIEAIEPQIDIRLGVGDWYKFYSSLFEDNLIPQGTGVAAFCIDQKVFAARYKHSKKRKLTGVKRFFSIKESTENGLSIQECDNKDYQLIGYIHLSMDEFHYVGKPYGILKTCLNSKVFYISPWDVTTNGSLFGLDHPFISQSVVNGKAEEC